MADAVITFFLDNLLQLIEQESKMMLGAEKELKSLQGHLVLMQSFIRDSEAVYQEQETVVALVKKIRELVYDAEDIVNNYKAGQERTRKWPFGSVSKLISDTMFAKRIQKVKKEIEEIYANKDRYGIVVKQPGEGPGMSPIMAAILQRRQVLDIVHSGNVHIVGFDDQKSLLIERLNKGKDTLTVVSIVGMAGLGKTTLAKAVCSDLRKHFNLWALISVSKVYKFKELLISIVKALRLYDERETNDEAELGSKLRAFLATKRYLIVLDDVWDDDAWRYMSHFFPDKRNGSRVLVTTRFTNVAEHADPTAVHQLRFLNDRESWELFKQKAFIGGNCPSEAWEALGKRIMKKCGGLPLAIVVLGGLLLAKSMLWEWERIADRVECVLSSDSEGGRDCAQILALSYYDLPCYLKPCFLYLGVFPEDHPVQARELIHLWVAEGFINQRRRQRMEEIAENYLEELAARSLIIINKRRSDNLIKNFTIHDLIRDLCIREGQEENLFQILGMTTLVDSPLSPPSFPRRLALDSCSQDEQPTSKPQRQRIRTLLYFEKGIYRWLQHLKDYRSLRVLEGFDYKGSELGKLVQLRYANFPLKFNSAGRLSFLTKINGRGQSFSYLSKLQNLQTIYIRSSHTLSEGDKNIPPELWKLKSLRHLYVISTGPMLFSLPQVRNSESTSLPHLQTVSFLCPVNLTNRHLGMMPALSKLHLSTRYRIGNSISADYLDKKHLSRVRELKLKGHWGSRLFPDSLSKLTLKCTAFGEDQMRVIEKLPNLQILKWDIQSYQERKIVFSENGFPSLQVLKFRFVGIEELVVEKGGLPSLSRLFVQNCQDLTKISEEMWSIRTLVLIDAQNPRRDLLQKLQEVQQQGQSWRIIRVSII